MEINCFPFFLPETLSSPSDRCYVSNLPENFFPAKPEQPFVGYLVQYSLETIPVCTDVICSLAENTGRDLLLRIAGIMEQLTQRPEQTENHVLRAVQNSTRKFS